MPHLEVAGKMENISAPRLPGDIGYDLRADCPVVVVSNAITEIPIGIRIAIPSGYWGLILGRSSANVKGVFVLPSVIDSGYRGPLFVYAIVLAGGPNTICIGNAVAQLILVPGGTLDIREASADFDNSGRGWAGFGSTGHCI